jgi:predicted phage tail protein
MFGAAGTGAGMVGATAVAGTEAFIAASAVGGISAAGTFTMAGAAAAAGTTVTGILAFQGAAYLGMGLLLGGASMLLAPDTPDGTTASKAENYLFSGPVNTVKQGEPIPLVYGRMITGSKTIMGSLFTTTSNNESQNLKTRKLVGIGGFRDDGDKHGENSPAGRYSYGYGPHHVGPKGGW